jgi:hypothetical protein
MSLPQKIKSRISPLLILAVAIVLVATGCNQTREKVAAFIQPQTVEEVTIEVNKKIEQGKFTEAQAEAEGFLNGKKDGSGKLAWALAKACAQTGALDLAIKYTEQALKVNAVTGPQAMAEPLLEPVRTDIRFVSLLAGVGISENFTEKSTNLSAKKTTESNQSSTSIRMDSKGTEVRAGDIVIKLPN